MSYVRSAVVLATVFVLCACTATTAVSPQYGKALSNLPNPLPRPRLIPDQPAVVWGNEYQVNAWQATGLFSSVTQTYNRVPTVVGVFIATECHVYSEQASALLTGSLWLLSLGILPAAETGHQLDCQTRVYQNGQELVNSRLQLHNRTLGNGFMVLPMVFQEAETQRLNVHDQAVLMVANAVRDLAEAQ